MANVNTFTFSRGVVVASPSKERWHPGDPLPWTSSVVDGVPCPAGMTYENCSRLKSEFIVKPDDVFVVTYPKSGTTWTLQIIKCLQTKGEPDTVTANLDALYLWLEDISKVPDSCDPTKVIEYQSDRPSPRIYKSHATYRMIVKAKDGEPPGKYIHIMRHPKDVCVSMYHHMRGFKSFDYNGPFSEFFDLFIHGMVELGSWFEYERAWWEHRNDDNVLMLKYEDLHTNTSGIVEKIASFIGIETTPDIITKTVERSQFKRMKADPAANMAWSNDRRAEGAPPFMRKGTVGDWKSFFTEEQNATFDRVFHEQLDGTGLEHEWEL